MGKERTADSKKKTGFRVGPANLSDGTYKRKVDKIKKTLIHKAKVKKQYSKTLSVENPSTDPHSLYAQKLLKEAERERRERAGRQRKENDDAEQKGHEPPAVHPDRQAAIDGADSAQQAKASGERQKRRPKTSAFKKEEEYAAMVKVERGKAAREAEERRREKERRTREREMRKKTMSAKTRHGQMKLGKMSQLLLEKVKHQMGE